jgi:hypothetical protein
MLIDLLQWLKQGPGFASAWKDYVMWRTLTVPTSTSTVANGRET